MKTVNPHRHAYPHAKLYNITLTSITRLNKSPKSPLRMIENDDVRNFAISKANEVAKLYGWRMPE